MKITIPMVPPSPNELRRKYRNPFAYKRLREAWENSIAYGVDNGREKQFLEVQGRGRVRVKITVFNSRMYDQDNLTGSIKPILDALKNIHFLKDDNAEWLELLPVQQYHAKRQQEQTVIEIEGAM